jgi:XRE family transcriptional regulator, aerobic/anaerobic benzoate catabolism transcriptional regulator
MSSTKAKMDPHQQALLETLNRRLRACRAEQKLTRKQLAAKAQISERHLANLESGAGNVSILILLQVAQALECSLAQLLGDFTTASREWLLLRKLLEDADDNTIRKVRSAVAPILGQSAASAAPSQRIALIGLRGAGKSTLGKLLAQHLGFAFVELSREIERVAGGPISEVQSLYGATAYRRYERRALETALATHKQAVVAMPGGVVMDNDNYQLILQSCTTIWLQAQPEDHMHRVIAQGDLRPMAKSREAMGDLRAILAAREPLYAKAEWALDTSSQEQPETLLRLLAWVAERLALKLPELVD